jgi:deaminated glutathione amidase
MRLAVWQAQTGIDPAANLAALLRAIDRAKAAGAQILFTPEMTGLLDRDRARAAQSLRTEVDDPLLAAARTAAADQAIWLALGSIGLRGARPDGRLVNRALLIDPNGRIIARYDKIHLFDVDLATGESWRESAAYAPGDQPVIAETPWGRIGLSVCYDVRFPALYQALSAAGADLLAVPAAFTVPTGQAHWHTLLKARAIENAAFVVAAAQCGQHADGRTTYGHSLVVSPWGEILLDLGAAIDQVAVVELDLASIATARSRVPVLAHRRQISEPVVMR